MEQPDLFSPKVPPLVEIISSKAKPLRPYQQQCEEATWKELETNRSTIFVMPTGTGKTLVFTSLAEHWPAKKPPGLSDRVLILANRDELISQGRDALVDNTEEEIGLEQNVFFAGSERIVVASIQSICMPDRLARFAPDHFGLVICDEADLSITPSWDRVLDHFPNAKIVGCTATPDRADGIALKRRYDSWSYVYEIHDAIKDGWLCPYTYEVVKINSIDLSLCRDAGGDFNQDDLDAVMVEKALWGIAKETLERSGSRRTLGFTTSADKAVRLAEICNQMRPGCAEAVSYRTPIDERRDILSRHRTGAFQYLWNMGIVSRGYNDPDIQCISMARPTKSRNLMTQMVGRGLRPKSTPPNDLCVIEFTGNHGRHKLACALDILGGRYPDHVVEAARKRIEAEPGLHANEALEAEAIADEKRKEEVRRSRVTVNVSASSYRYSPLDLLHVKRDAIDEWEEVYGGKSATPKQVAYLQRSRIPIPANLTCRQAKKLQGSLFMRRQLGLASFGQVEKLAKFGVSALNIKFETASRVLDAIASKGWRALTQAEYDGAVHRTREPGEDDDRP